MTWLRTHRGQARSCSCSSAFVVVVVAIFVVTDKCAPGRCTSSVHPFCCLFLAVVVVSGFFLLPCPTRSVWVLTLVHDTARKAAREGGTCAGGASAGGAGAGAGASTNNDAPHAANTTTTAAVPVPVLWWRHPAHNHALRREEHRSAGCDVCSQACVAAAYTCVEGCDYDLCCGCMLQRAAFVGNGVVPSDAGEIDPEALTLPGDAVAFDAERRAVVFHVAGMDAHVPAGSVLWFCRWATAAAAAAAAAAVRVCAWCTCVSTPVGCNLIV